MDEHSGGSDLDPCSILQGGLLDLLSVHHNAVGRTKIDDVDAELRTGRIDSDLGVPAGNSRVVDAQIGLTAAADHQARRLQRMPCAVDF